MSSLGVFLGLRYHWLSKLAPSRTSSSFDPDSAPRNLPTKPPGLADGGPASDALLPAEVLKLLPCTSSKDGGALPDETGVAPLDLNPPPISRWGTTAAGTGLGGLLPAELVAACVVVGREGAHPAPAVLRGEASVAAVGGEDREARRCCSPDARAEVGTPDAVRAEVGTPDAVRAEVGTEPANTLLSLRRPSCDMSRAGTPERAMLPTLN